MTFPLVILIALARMTRLLPAQYARRRVRHETMLAPAPAMDPECGCARSWVVVNPSRHANFNVFKAQIEKTATEMGVSQIQWCETNVEDPDTGQALRATVLGAPLVAAVGGNGTVCTVAAGLAGVGVRMGVIPVGTDNPLTRNLEFPTDDAPAAIWVALGNEHRFMDCGWLRVDGIERPSSLSVESMLVRATRICLRVDRGVELFKSESLPSADEYSFVVTSGLGFDGETMMKIDPGLKRRIDWVAYVIVALGVMTIVRTGIHVILRRLRLSDDPVRDASATLSSSGAVTALATFEGEELSDVPEQRIAQIKSKPLMSANCGGLPYATPAPEARLDDGLPDVIAVDTQAGLLGWADLSWKALFQRFGLKTLNPVNPTDQTRSRQIEGVSVHAHTPQTV